MKVKDANIGDVLLFQEEKYTSIAFRLISPLFDDTARVVPVRLEQGGIFIPCGQVCVVIWDADCILLEEPYNEF